MLPEGAAWYVPGTMYILTTRPSTRSWPTNPRDALRDRVVNPGKYSSQVGHLYNNSPRKIIIIGDGGSF